MAIAHKMYFDGKVQSLGYRIGEQDITVGVLEPGSYDFGVAERTEMIVVMEGTLRKTNMESYERGGIPCQFRVGDRIRIECDEPVAYICYFE